MAQLILKNLVVRVFRKLGNITTNQLSMFTLMENLYSAVNKRIVQLRLSPQNYQLKSVPVHLVGGRRDYAIPADDFGREVVIEFSNSSGSSIPVEMQNFANIINSSSDLGERPALAFYTTDVGEHRLRINYLPESSAGYTMKVWYEPDTPIARRLSASLPISSQYADIIVIDCSLSSIGHVLYSTDAKTNSYERNDKRIDLIREKQEWEELWDEETMPSKTQTKVIRRGFHAGI